MAKQYLGAGETNEQDSKKGQSGATRDQPETNSLRVRDYSCRPGVGIGLVHEAVCFPDSHHSHTFHGETVCLRLARLRREKLHSSPTPSSVTKTEHMGFSTSAYIPLHPILTLQPSLIIICCQLMVGRDLTKREKVGKADLHC